MGAITRLDLTRARAGAPGEAFAAGSPATLSARWSGDPRAAERA